MKLLHDFKLPLLFFIIVEAVVLFLFYQIKEEKRNIYLQSQVSQFQKEYDTIIESYYLVSRTLFDEVINTKEVIDIFKNANKSDEAGQSVLREKLFKKLEPTYNRLKQKNLKQLHFHLPDTTSFLRFHRPGKYGDNLQKIRFSLVKANTEKIPVTGFEEGRIYNGFRYVFPLFDGNTHIGSVETSLSFKAIREEMTKLYDGEYDFMIAKNTVESKLFKSELDNYIPSDISENYYFEKEMVFDKHSDVVSKEHDHIEHDKITELNHHLVDDGEVKAYLEKKEAFAKGFKTKDGCYLVTFIPIENVEKKKVAYLISYRRDHTIGSFDHDMHQKMVISTLLILILIAFMYKNEKLNTLLKRQLELEKKEKEQSKKLLVQHSKLAGLGEMIGSIAHQWKQPLNSLGLIIQDLPEAYEYGEMDKQYLDGVVDTSMQQIDFMTRTIEDFRNFFKPSLKQEQFNIADSVEDITKLLAPQFKSKEITLDIQNRLDGQMVKGIKNEFDQVVFNLLNNAKEAIIDAGVKGKISITMDGGAKEVTLAVQDNGGGVSNDIIGKIFDPYTTSKGESGTGIGLYMAKTIIQEHMGGRITLNNQENGVAFFITLPAVKTSGEKV